MSGENGVAKGIDRTWKSRRCAWVFGFSYESVFGKGVARITDGEAFRVYEVWDAGIEPDKGESEKTRCVAWTDQASEFFSTIERTIADLMALGQKFGPHCPLSRWAFWLEPAGDGANYRCRYVMRPGTTLAEVMVLRDRLERRGRGVFVMSVKQHNLTAIRDDIEIDP